MTKRVTILGGGESGTGAALLAKAKGLSVFLSEKGTMKDSYRQTLSSSNIDFEENGHTEEKVLSADIIIKSPGIPDQVPILVEAKKRGISIVSEIEFALLYTNAKVIGITGTNGKTTTAMLTHHLLIESGKDSVLAGNVGDSFALAVLNHDPEYFVVELSSFQIDGMYSPLLHSGILLNITPDHLDRYGSFEAYAASKIHLSDCIKSGGRFIINARDPEIIQRISAINSTVDLVEINTDRQATASYYDPESDVLSIFHNDEKFEINAKDLPLKGRHNYLNVLAASQAVITEVTDFGRIRSALQNFIGAHHRLEFCGSIDGAKYYNDSKATNVDAVYYALDSFSGNIIWIAGGIDKGNNYAELEELVSSRVKALIALGTDNSKLTTFFNGKVGQVYETGSMQSAIDKAFEVVESGDVVLLSPACASFDLFDNYQDRGNQFKQNVERLKSKKL